VYLGRVISDASGLAGLGAGATEAVAVVTPMEVVKIRLQAQQRKLQYQRTGTLS
jgi:solute carrier family 25 citrate transporter 1